MDPEFWHERWKANQIGFHQDEINAYLERYWLTLGLEPGSRVLVPLCGKSVDLLWLREQGHAVVGIELSRIAVQAFFEEHGITPVVQEGTHCTRWSCAGIELLCGDFFDLETTDLGKVDALYDRAALIALTDEQRSHYAQRLTHLLEPGTPGLLVTLDYDQTEMNGPPFAVSGDEVQGLYQSGFHIQHLTRFDALAANPHLREKGLNSLTEHVYRIDRKGHSE
jgi:thiopurine S-methyltransferase